jgi:hypothetical protein
MSRIGGWAIVFEELRRCAMGLERDNSSSAVFKSISDRDRLMAGYKTFYWTKRKFDRIIAPCCADLLTTKQTSRRACVLMKTEDYGSNARRPEPFFFHFKPRPVLRLSNRLVIICRESRIFPCFAFTYFGVSLFWEYRSLVSWQQDCRFTYRSRGRNLLPGGK